MENLHPVQGVEPFFLIVQSEDRPGAPGQIRPLAAQVHHVTNAGGADSRGDADANDILIVPEIESTVMGGDHGENGLHPLKAACQE